MSVYAVIPLKSLRYSKERLSSVFTPQERRLFTLAMLEDVLTVVKASAVDEVVVTGEDTEVQRMVEKFDMAYLSAGGAALNPAIAQAAAWCQTRDAAAILVLPADIPFVDAKDINRILQLGEGGCSAVVLSPSHNWGTNALYQRPPTLIRPCFGRGSFLNHIREAYQQGVSVRLHFSRGLATDIDSAEDLKKLADVPNETVTTRVLELITRSSKTARNFLSQKT